ncbi:MAG TPA: DUF2129 domain-containing protein [Bacillales bacterium]|nr:DUF2129 domain-containing protein [Bacillales bacterium]
MFKERVGLIVWIRSLKPSRSLRKYGNVHYVSKRLKYAVLYCDADNCEQTAERLNALPYVKDVQLSQRPFLKTEFEQPSSDKAKEYDYKLKI